MSPVYNFPCRKLKADGTRRTRSERRVRGQLRYRYRSGIPARRRARWRHGLHDPSIYPCPFAQQPKSATPNRHAASPQQRASLSITVKMADNSSTPTDFTGKRIIVTGTLGKSRRLSDLRYFFFSRVVFCLCTAAAGRPSCVSSKMDWVVHAGMVNDKAPFRPLITPCLTASFLVDTPRRRFIG